MNYVSRIFRDARYFPAIQASLNSSRYFIISSSKKSNIFLHCLRNRL